MSVTLSLDYLESNDNKTFLLTDSTGAYNASTNVGGWGTPNELVSGVVATTITTAGNLYHLTLDIVYTDSSGTDTTYDTIDLYTEFTSEFTKSYGMEYELNMSHLEVSGVAAGDSDDVFPDGNYNITYTLAVAETDVELDSNEDNELLSGVVKNLVYDDIHDVPNIYKQKDFNRNERDWVTLLDSLFSYSYYNSLITNIKDDEIDNKLEMLYFLEQRLN